MRAAAETVGEILKMALIVEIWYRPTTDGHDTVDTQWRPFQNFRMYFQTS